MGARASIRWPGYAGKSCLRTRSLVACFCFALVVELRSRCFVMMAKDIG
jgi:hypothetical protein